MKIITGASKGIGKYLLEKYANSGETVYGTYLSTMPSSEFAANYTKIDVSNNFEVNKWVNSINLSDKIDILNCAAINYNSFAHKADPESWIRTIEINLIGTFNVIHALLPIMRKNNYGRIINFSSVVAQSGVPGTSAYAASKAGLWGLTKAVAVENASKGITINNLNLGYFNIGMGEEISSEIRNKLKGRIPANEFGDAINIFNAINFLIENSYINGTSIDINGGLF
jgi:NAD(P)-dependent dehydrogenase (short-subunit alcohol dehydrogenase family)